MTSSIIYIIIFAPFYLIYKWIFGKPKVNKFTIKHNGKTKLQVRRSASQLNHDINHNLNNNLDENIDQGGFILLSDEFHDSFHGGH